LLVLGEERKRRYVGPRHSWTCCETVDNDSWRRVDSRSRYPACISPSTRSYASTFAEEVGIAIVYTRACMQLGGAHCEPVSISSVPVKRVETGAWKPLLDRDGCDWAWAGGRGERSHGGGAMAHRTVERTVELTSSALPSSDRSLAIMSQLGKTSSWRAATTGEAQAVCSNDAPVASSI